MTGPYLRLAVLGDPLAHTRSPDLHRAGLAALGLAGDSVARRTPAGDLESRLRELAEGGFLGTNLTHPLKEAALGLVAHPSDEARRARSVNTIGFAAGGWWGDTTDGAGMVDLLGSLGREASHERAVLLGAGGAARSVALALGAKVTVSARHPEAAREAWMEVPNAELVGWRSAEEAASLRQATLVINATTLASEHPVPLEGVPRQALILDLVYGVEITPWVRQARAEGREAYDGLGLLVFQARRSLALWLSLPVPVEPLARAVGWPR